MYVCMYVVFVFVCLCVCLMLWCFVGDFDGLCHDDDDLHMHACMHMLAFVCLFV